jgi:NAD(P)-dependent dehydrogenase (short-subunit alcohol dehydrogenase family)
MNEKYVQSLLSLDGKTAIVTGGSQGIGRGVAVALGGLGADVCILGRNQKLLDETVALVTEAGGGCRSYVVDVSRRSVVDSFFEQFSKDHEKLDIFVNNAGISIHKYLDETPPEEVDRLLDTNVKAAIHCMNHAARLMKPRRSGVIIVITSVNGMNPLPGQGMYSVTKYALEGAAKALAGSLAEYGIRVNTCAPGAIDTAINKEALENEASRNEVLSRIPMRKIGTIADIGDAVACLASDAFNYVTGATIVVDGGMSLKKK